MIKPPISLQDLRRSLYVKAKAEPAWRFWGLFVHVCKMETLREAYKVAKSNDGAPGSDAGKAIGTLGEADGTLVGPLLSPDGRQAVVERSARLNRDLWILDAARTWRFTFDPGSDRFLFGLPTAHASCSTRTGTEFAIFT